MGEDLGIGLSSFGCNGSIITLILSIFMYFYIRMRL